MADARTTHKAQIWSCPPEEELRRIKTMVEHEMMIKLGAQKETIEFHPLILAQRAARAKTSFQLDYCRVKPPYQEKVPPNRDPWGNTNQAIRQLAHTRQGPRKTQLPTVPHTKAVRRVSLPPEDEEFRRLRILRLTKRDEILSEWSALQYQAYAVRRLSHLSLPDIDPLRRYSSCTLAYSVRSPSEHAEKDVVVISPKKTVTKAKAKVVVPFTNVPPTGKPRSRWRGMARKLLWNAKGAQMLLPEELPRSEVRIYISCTEDLAEEREFLSEVAYPELRKFCEKQGLSCHVVDLRQGSSRLKNDRETFDVIQREVEHCQKHSIGPCFVSLMGREADDSELPGWLSKDAMMAVRSVLVKREKDKAVDTLDNLYRLDSNYQPPIYLLEENFFFAETEETHILRKVLPDVFAQLRQEGKLEEEPGYYSWSSTVKEIQAGLLSCLEPKRQTVCLMARAGDSKPNTPMTKTRGKARTKNANADTTANNNTSSDNNNMRASSAASASSRASSVPSEYTTVTGDDSADRLRAEIVDCYNRMGNRNNLILFNAGRKTLSYLREVCSLFLSAVTRLIERQMTHHEFDISHHLSHGADVVQHVAVARQMCANFMGGADEVSSIPEYLRDVGHVKPMVVVGPEGAGKTALTSLIATALHRADPLRKIVFRIVGLTLNSSSLLHLVTSLYHQVCFLYDEDAFLPVDITLKGTLQAFRGLLHDIRDKTLHKGPLTIVLDGVDKVHDMVPKHLSYLMGSLPQGITLLMSMQNSGPLYETAKAMEGTEFVHCPTFSREQTKTYIQDYFSKHNRVVTNDQFRAILKELSGHTVPLVAQISATVACRWPSHTFNDDLDISKDLESAFHRLVESCEVQLGHSFTKYVMSLLVASRFGLADFEILHILAADSDLLDEIKEEAEDLSVLEGFPYQTQLSRLLARIEPFLHEVKTEGETILKLSHETLKSVLRVRFLSDVFKHRIHSRLATFFQFTRRGNLLSSRDIVEGRHKNLSHYLWRTLRSVPYHLCHSHADPEEVWKKLKSDVFMKFPWIINEIYAGFFNDFIDDVNYALETLGLDSEVMFLRQFLIGVRQTVIFNPVSLASLLAGQNMAEMGEVQKSVQEAQVWLKQVHLQVLVPTAYTTPKTSQLQLNASLATSVNALVTDSLGERVILQHENHLTTLEHATGENTTLVTLTNTIVSAHVWGDAMLTVVTKSPQRAKLALETYAVDKGRHIKTTALKESPVTWLHVRDDGVAFYASKLEVKKVLLEKGQVIELYKTNEEIVDACMSDKNKFKVVSLHSVPKALLHLFDSRVPSAVGTIYLNKDISRRCKPLLITKDCIYAAVVCDRELAVVDLSVEQLMYVLDFNNVPVSLTAFSRSQEHIFVALPTGVIRCFKLLTGAEVMQANIHSKQKVKRRAPSSSPQGRRSGSPGGRNRTPGTPSPIRLHRMRTERQDKDEELVTTVITSEDDHFLLAGTTRGKIHVLHVPTGLGVCVVNCGPSGVKAMAYFSNVSWFQSVVTVDVAGLVKLWNLRPLLTRARTLIMNIIADEDLMREEKPKLDLGVYYNHFKEHRNDRMFLNGPDISAFYKKHPPSDLFAPLQGMDPVLQSPESWMVTGCLADCTDVCALSTGSDLSDVLVTATKHGDLARWSLYDGSLLSVRAAPCPVEDGAAVESLKSVFYDQAVCLVVREPNNRKTVAVQYVDEKKKQPILLKESVVTHISSNGSLMVQVCCKQLSEVTLVYWSLVNGHELNRFLLSDDVAFIRLASTLNFTNDLTSCVLLMPRGNEESTMYVWTFKINVDEEEEEGDDEEVVTQRSEVVTQRSTRSLSARSGRTSSRTSSDRSPSPRKPSQDFVLREREIPFRPSAVGIAFSDAIILGTPGGLVLMVAMESLKVTTAFTAQGLEPVKNQPVLSSTLWDHFAPAHASGVKLLTCATGSHVIASSCGKTLCVWNLLTKRLVVRSSLGDDDEFQHHILSRDCRVLTYVTSAGVMAVWGINKKKQLCAFRLQSRVTHLAMTPDCHRVALLQSEGVTSRIRVFDVRNIDDIRLDENNDSEKDKDTSRSGDSGSENTE
ncbi:uncharacterized protein [Littorina saxatilis]